MKRTPSIWIEDAGISSQPTSWSQAEAAEVLGINQPKVSALLKFRLEGFSVERLMTFLTALGNDIEISIKPRRSGRRLGRIVVEAA